MCAHNLGKKEIIRRCYSEGGCICLYGAVCHHFLTFVGLEGVYLLSYRSHDCYIIVVAVRLIAR